MSGPQQRIGIAVPLQQLAAVVLVAALALSLAPQTGFLLPAAMAALWPPAVALRPPAVRATLAAYAPFAAIWIAVLIGYLRLMHAAGWPVPPQDLLERLGAKGTDLDGFWFVVVAIVVVAPVTEELVFRGYLFTALDVVLPRWATHLVTAAVFGLAHGPGYALPIGVLALLFGYLRARHSALLPAMLAHAVHNGLTVLVTVAWPDTLAWLYPQ